MNFTSGLITTFGFSFIILKISFINVKEKVELTIGDMVKLLRFSEFP